MTSFRTLAAHLLTAGLTFLLVVLWFGSNRERPVRVPPAQRPSPARPQTAPGPSEPESLPAPLREPYVEPDTPPPALPEDLSERASPDEEVNIRVYEAVNRGVVNITSATRVERFFSTEISESTGSGFVLDKQGHILTNYHVVSEADGLEVTLFDGSTHPARVIGADPDNDVAVVRIDVPKDQLHPLALGDSSSLLVGQKVLAVGNPFGLERTLTTGIISSLDRSMKAKNGRTIKGIIQSDAAINPGNSGGPLLNSRGEVIGMNTAIISQVGQSAGIGFAVPINGIKRILKPLIETGHVVRADLGLHRVFTTEDGIYIIDLVEGGPADLAGLRPIQVIVERFGQFYRTRPDPDSADRIIAIDGQPVHSVEEMLSLVEAHQPGEQAVVTVVRHGKRRDVPVTLGATD